MPEVIKQEGSEPEKDSSNESDSSSEESQEVSESKPEQPTDVEDHEHNHSPDEPSTKAPEQITELNIATDGTPFSTEGTSQEQNSAVSEETVQTAKPELVDPPVNQPADSDTEASQQQELEAHIPIQDVNPQVSNEIPEVTPQEQSTPTTTEEIPVEAPRIPGEGSCLVEGKTYAHNTIVPTENPCQEVCRCYSSIVSCKSRACPPAPSADENCMPVSTPGSCCPTYMCGKLFI